MNASSLTAKGSAPCTIKNATTIVTIIGIRDNLYRKPRIKAKEQISSPKIANINEVLLPNPIGSGKPNDICSNAFHFCNPCSIINVPKTTLMPSKNKDVFVSSGFDGNKKKII